MSKDVMSEALHPNSAQQGKDDSASPKSPSSASPAYITPTRNKYQQINSKASTEDNPIENVSDKLRIPVSEITQTSIPEKPVGNVKDRKIEFSSSESPEDCRMHETISKATSEDSPLEKSVLQSEPSSSSSFQDSRKRNTAPNIPPPRNTSVTKGKVSSRDVSKENSPGSSPDSSGQYSGAKKRSASEAMATSAIEKALLEMAPRKAKRMFDRRKRARANGEDDAAGFWDDPSTAKKKTHSLKQIQRLSNELEQVLGVLCNGDKNVAVDVLSHLMTRRHMGADLFRNIERKISNISERNLDNRIVDGIFGFFEHHHTRGTRPTEAARAVDAVMVACCWDVCDADEYVSDPSKSPESPGSDENISSENKKKPPMSSGEKKISNSALVERLGVNRCALKRARTKAKSIKMQVKAHYRFEDRRLRKDKGVPARLYREVKKVEEATGSPRQTSEYAAIDVLTKIGASTENKNKKSETSIISHLPPQQRGPNPSPLYGYPTTNPHIPAVTNQNVTCPPPNMMYRGAKISPQYTRDQYQHYNTHPPQPHATMGMIDSNMHLLPTNLEPRGIMNPMQSRYMGVMGAANPHISPNQPNLYQTQPSFMGGIDSHNRQGSTNTQIDTNEAHAGVIDSLNRQTPPDDHEEDKSNRPV